MSVLKNKILKIALKNDKGVVEALYTYNDLYISDAEYTKAYNAFKEALHGKRLTYSYNCKYIGILEIDTITVQINDHEDTTGFISALEVLYPMLFNILKHPIFFERESLTKMSSFHITDIARLMMDERTVLDWFKDFKEIDDLYCGQYTLQRVKEISPDFTAGTTVYELWSAYPIVYTNKLTDLSIIDIRHVNHVMTFKNMYCIDYGKMFLEIEVRDDTVLEEIKDKLYSLYRDVDKDYELYIDRNQLESLFDPIDDHTDLDAFYPDAYKVYAYSNNNASLRRIEAAVNNTKLSPLLIRLHGEDNALNIFTLMSEDNVNKATLYLSENDLFKGLITNDHITSIAVRDIEGNTVKGKGISVSQAAMSDSLEPAVEIYKVLQAFINHLKEGEN